MFMFRPVLGAHLDHWACLTASLSAQVESRCGTSICLMDQHRQPVCGDIFLKKVLLKIKQSLTQVPHIFCFNPLQSQQNKRRKKRSRCTCAFSVWSLTFLLHSLLINFVKCPTIVTWSLFLLRCTWCLKIFSFVITPEHKLYFSFRAA